MSVKNGLKEYRKKRDFSKTGEPSGEKKEHSGKPIFVVQKHDATNLHYDFRLEMDGVLRSWVIPKGPSINPSVRRLAMRTEDHPLEYADFEGVIPEDEYGGGSVMVWDKGTYKNLREEKEGDKKSIGESINEGKLEIYLHGEKLKGGFALIRTGGGEKERWLLIKMKDEEANRERDLLIEQSKSVISGRTIDDIKEESK